MEIENIISELSKAGLTGKYGEQGDHRWVKVWVRDRYCCVYCGVSLLDDIIRMSSAQIDHLLPKWKYKSYENFEINMVLACYCCNQIKGKFDPLEKLSDEERRLISPKTFEKFRDKLLDACRDYLRPILKKKERILYNSKDVLKKHGKQVTPNAK